MFDILFCSARWRFIWGEGEELELRLLPNLHFFFSLITENWKKLSDTVVLYLVSLNSRQGP
jgi:hypothetical protein